MEQQQSSSSTSDNRGLSLPPSSGQAIVKSNALSKKDKNQNMDSKTKSPPDFDNVRVEKVSQIFFFSDNWGLLLLPLPQNSSGQVIVNSNSLSKKDKDQNIVSKIKTPPDYFYCVFLI